MLVTISLRFLPFLLLIYGIYCNPIIPFPSDFSAKSSDQRKKYTTFQCLGGSQVFNTDSMKQASIKVFPLNNPEFRTCHYRNICLVNGTLTYFQKYPEGNGKNGIPKEFLPSGFNGNVNFLSYLRDFTMPVSTVVGSIPSDYSFSPIPVTFLDSCSWSFNYGHYLNDNIIPTFTTHRLFDFPLESYPNSQQLFETSCRQFSTLDAAFANRVVTYNHSMGTYRQACLERLNKMWVYFFKNPPLYVDDLAERKQTMCFKHLITGQGSTFGLKSIDLSRAYFFREFRNYVLSRITLKPPKQVEDLILVGQRTVGSAGGSIINDLCDLVTKAKESLLTPEYKKKYRVECFIPSDLQFEDEIYQVQRAKVLISVHGTISYMSLFSRDGTQQISVASPKELKENQMLLYATHFHTHYLTWDKLDQLSGVLEHALTLSEAHYDE
jgi:hypothetical protein